MKKTGIVVGIPNDLEIQIKPVDAPDTKLNVYAPSQEIEILKALLDSDELTDPLLVEYDPKHCTMEVSDEVYCPEV